jgi:hypothetical protein
MYVFPPKTKLDELGAGGAAPEFLPLVKMATAKPSMNKN